MKKKILLIFSLLALMVFGQATIVSAQCDIVIDMQDSYGDGWNGASLKVYNGADLLGTATIANGTSGQAIITVPDMALISLVWVSGSYDGEISFTVTNGIGIQVYVCELLGAPDAGEFFVFTNVCSSEGIDVNLIDFPLPSKVAVGDIEIEGVIRNERDTPITSFDLVYSLDGTDSDVVTIDGLNLAFNETSEFVYPQLVTIDVGIHEFELRVENINAQGDDDDPNNNSLSAEVLCVNEIFAKNVVYEEATGT